MFVVYTNTCVPLEVNSSISQHYPVLLSGEAYYRNNAFHVPLLAPLVANRTYDIRFANQLNSTQSPTSWKCIYGPLSYWTTTFNSTSCQYRFTVDVPWKDHASCGFNLISNSGAYAQYGGTLKVTWEEEFWVMPGSLSMTREASTEYKLFVNFPLYLDVEVTDITIKSVVDMQIYLYSFNFSSSTRQLRLQLMATVNWPNMLTGPTTVLPPNGVHMAGDVDISGCAVDNQVCKQTLGFWLALDSSDSCTFDGLYSVNTTIVTCRDFGGVNCTTAPVYIQFQISKSDACGQVSTSPLIKSSLQVYKTDLITKPAIIKLGDTISIKAAFETLDTISTTFVGI